MNSISSTQYIRVIYIFTIKMIWKFIDIFYIVHELGSVKRGSCPEGKSHKVKVSGWRRRYVSWGGLQ